MRTGIILQARLSPGDTSSHLLKPLGTTTAIGFLMARLKKLAHLGPVILATSSDKCCDPLEAEAKKIGGIEVVRGDDVNVLSRFITAVDKYKLDLVARITGGNIFLDPKVVEGMVEHAERFGLDLVDNFRGPMPFPMGLNLDVITASALRRSAAAADLADEDKLHVVTYARKHVSGGAFSMGYYNAPYRVPLKMRLILDGPEDYSVLTGIFQKFANPAEEISVESILKLWATQRGLFEANQAIHQKFISSRGSTFEAKAPWEALVVSAPKAAPAASSGPTKRAFVTGVTGQDGSWMADLLLSKGYEVHGLMRRSANPNTEKIDHLIEDVDRTNSKLHLHYGDLSDGASLSKLISEIKPDEIYNLGAMSHVRVSFDQPVYTGDVTGVGTMRLLEAMRQHCPQAHFYQASTSELYGGQHCPPTGYTEESPFHPRSPYGVAKIYGYWACVNYREAYNLHISNGILFNHEGERRGETFVTRKITRAVGRIKAGLQKEIYLGNLDAKRDWGDAKEYVRAMWMMLQQEKGDDFVVATGETHSIREFLEEAFGYVNMDWKDFTKTDASNLRPSEVDVLLGDPSKAKRQLGWKCETSFRQLVRRMVDYDIELALREKSETYLI